MDSKTNCISSFLNYLKHVKFQKICTLFDDMFCHIQKLSAKTLPQLEKFVWNARTKYVAKKVIISDHGTKNCMNKCYLDKQKTILDYFAIWHANKMYLKNVAYFGEAQYDTCVIWSL